MIIGVDCAVLGIKNSKDRGGIYSLSKVLLEQLGKIDKKNEYILYSFYPIDKKIMSLFGKSMKNVVVKPSKGWVDIWMPLKLDKDKPDIFIGLSQAIPRKIPFFYYPKTIALMYDLGFEKMPEMYSEFPKRLKRNSKYAAINSNILISTSKSSKRDMVSLYKINSSKIKVLYPNIENVFSNKGSKFKNSNPYFLFVGAFKKSKNLTNIIKAFLYFSEKSKTRYDLILAGGEGEEIKILTDSKNLGIKIMGFVDDTTLGALYRGATAFVSPSYYEGFGMTFLEAMKSGCPVIGSNKGSIPEVVSDAAILTSPNNYKKIADEMIRLSLNKKIQDNLSKAGIKRSKDFSSVVFARNILDVINSL